MNYTSDNDVYYLKYGLSRDPFPVDVSDNIYYLTPELNHRIELIKHLLEFSQQLLVVTAPEGAGKTTLCRYLPSSFDKSWTVCIVNVTDDMEPAVLAAAINHEFNPDEDQDPKTSIGRLNKYLEYCGRQHLFPVIIIDDGHKLSIDTLELILKLNEAVSNNISFRVVIFGEAGLNESFNDPRIKISTTGILHDISIPLFTSGQVAAYIEHRLTSCGEITRYPFTDRDADQIFRVSGGVAAKINKLARQAMQEPSGLNSGEGNSYTFFSNPLIRLITHPLVLALIICMGIAAYFIAEELRKQPERPEQLNVALPPEQKLSKAPDSSEEIEEPVVAEETQAASTGPATDSGPVPSADELYMETLQEEQTKITGPENDMVVLEAPSRAEEILAIDEKPVAEIQPVRPELITDQTELISPFFAGLKGNNWVRAQEPGKYVLQLIGARDIRTLEQYLETYPELRDGLAVITTVNDGKPWYVFIYGEYPDRAAATADLNNLPANIRRAQPWPRPLASVQLDLEKAK